MILSPYQNPEGTLKDGLSSRTDLRLKILGKRKNSLKDVEDRTVLDIGCNNGYFTREAIRCGATRAVGVDNSDCIKGAIRLAEQEGVNAEFWQVDVESKEFKRHCPRFDAVILFSMLTHLKDPEGFLDWLDSRIRYVLLFESNHGEKHKNQIELVKKHIYFTKIDYLGISEVPEHPHHMWICRKGKYQVKYPKLNNIPVEFIPIEKIFGWEEEFVTKQKIKYSLDSKKFFNLKEDIRRRGIREPLILKVKSNRLVGFQGIHRYFAAIQLGYKYVPCKIL